MTAPLSHANRHAALKGAGMNELQQHDIGRPYAFSNWPITRPLTAPAMAGAFAGVQSPEPEDLLIA
jgi:hypothetical protein